MKVIERCCRGKHADQTLNEDGLFVGDAFAGNTFVAVVDGVTGKSVRRPWRPSGGVVAKDLMLDVLAALPADAGMREVQRSVDERFREAYRTHPLGSSFFEREPLERLQANAVVYSAARGEAWLFGDCQIMVNGMQVPTMKRVDMLLGELRAFATLALREQHGADRPAPRSPDPAREMIMPFLRLQSRFANKRGPYGYFVFDGYTDPTYPIRTVHVGPGDEVVLASDGYPILRPTLAESEHELARLKREDPALIGPEYQSTKGFTRGLDSFDDRTYLRFVA